MNFYNFFVQNIDNNLEIFHSKYNINIIYSNNVIIFDNNNVSVIFSKNNKIIVKTFIDNDKYYNYDLNCFIDLLDSEAEYYKKIQNILNIILIILLKNKIKKE
jgi:hypothetical protein